MDKDKFKIGNKEYNSRLIIGTGRYKSFKQMKEAFIASEAEIVTVAVSKVNIEKKDEPRLQDFVDPNKYTYLPNTAGCYSSDEAIRILRLAKQIGGWNLVKLEILSKHKTLYPDVIETVKAAEILIKDGFEVMVYTNDDPIVAKKLADIGCVAIMPLGAPIGSGLGMQNELNIQFIQEEIKDLPIIVDAGIGTASDASRVMELGCTGVLTNTAIAQSDNPILMAKAMCNAVKAGRQAFLAGRIKKQLFATPSSPIK